MSFCHWDPCPTTQQGCVFLRFYFAASVLIEVLLADQHDLCVFQPS